MSVCPENAVARTRLGLGWASRGNLVAADREDTTALAVYPEYHVARAALAELIRARARSGLASPGESALPVAPTLE